MHQPKFQNKFGPLRKYGWIKILLLNYLVGDKTASKVKYYDTSSNSSRISTSAMHNILDQLKRKTKRSSTDANYFSIWRKFNNFVIQLDRKPESWEERMCLYGAYLIDSGIQSSTLKSYFSAIKAVLREDGYTVDQNKLLLTSLAKACKIVNDRVRTRLPIRKKLMELILFEVQRTYSSQPYLETLYKAMIILGYYGLFRIGELAAGTHTVKACDVHIAQNKDKMLFILYSSKTHGQESRPQKVKIVATNPSSKTFFCPFRIAREYLGLRGNYCTDDEPFFIFRDKQSVLPSHIRNVLRSALKSMNLPSFNYSYHSLRIGRCSDLISFGTSFELVKLAGRWQSNAVYKYI